MTPSPSINTVVATSLPVTSPTYQLEFFVSIERGYRPAEAHGVKLPAFRGPSKATRIQQLWIPDGERPRWNPNHRCRNTWRDVRWPECNADLTRGWRFYMFQATSIHPAFPKCPDTSFTSLLQSTITTAFRVLHNHMKQKLFVGKTAVGTSNQWVAAE